ncbi:MAG: FecR domain-containing protein [Pseudomonadota bacterium]
MRKRLRPETEAILQAAHDWMLLLESPEVSRADQKRFEDWLLADPRHSDVYDSAITFRAGLTQLDKTDFTARVNTPSLRERLTALLDTLAQPRARAGLGVAFAGAVVAATAVFVVLPGVRATDKPALDVTSVRYATNIGETKQLNLPDGTRVTLGAASQLRAQFSGKSRVIELTKGAAFFDVAPDPEKPFSVNAGALTATAIGTTFDVRSNVGVMRVGVSEGIVDVSYPLVIDGTPARMRSRQKLVAGQQIAAVRAQGMGKVEAVSITKVGAWRKGRLVYSGAALAEVIADANRYSKTPIEIEDSSNTLARLKLSGAFIGRDVDALLATLTDIHPVAIDRSDASRIVLRGRAPATK